MLSGVLMKNVGGGNNYCEEASQNEVLPVNDDECVHFAVGAVQI